MLKRKNGDERIENVMESTQGMLRAETPPFFYTRLMAKMDKAGNSQASALFRRPVLSVVTLAVLLVLNISVVVHYAKAEQQPIKETNGFKSLASEMNRDYSTAYDKTTN